MQFTINPFTHRLDAFEQTAPGSAQIEKLTGDSGGAVTGDLVNHNIFILGGTGISVAGTPGTNTLTINQTGAFKSIITTNGAQTKTILTIIPTNNSINTIEARISGFGTPIGVGADSGIGGTLQAVFITGTVASVTIDTPDYFRQSNLAISSTFSIIPDPTPGSKNILIKVVGDALFNINWVCEVKLTEAV